MSDPRFEFADGAIPDASVLAGVAGLHPRGEPERDNIIRFAHNVAKQIKPRRALYLRPLFNFNYVAYVFVKDEASVKASFSASMDYAPATPVPAGEPIFLNRGGEYWIKIVGLDAAAQAATYLFSVHDAASTPRDGDAYGHIYGYDPRVPGRYPAAGVDAVLRALLGAPAVKDGYIRAKAGRLWYVPEDNGGVTCGLALVAANPQFLIYDANDDSTRRRTLRRFHISMLNASAITPPLYLKVLTDTTNNYTSGGATCSPVAYANDAGTTAEFSAKSARASNIVITGYTASRIIHTDQWATVPENIYVDLEDKPQVNPAGAFIFYIYSAGAVNGNCAICADVMED